MRLSVRMSVRYAVAPKPLLFSETLQLVRACKREKCSKRFFENSRFAHLGQKLYRGFRIFFAIRTLEFANFLY